METKLLIGIVLLVVGALYLLQELNLIDFWTLSWYTVAYILLGAGILLKK